MTGLCDKLAVRWCRNDRYDLGALVKVHAACFPAEGWTADDFGRFADRPGRIVKCIVTEEDEVVGGLLYRNLLDHVRVARLGVLPAHPLTGAPLRRRGAARGVLLSLVGPNSPNRRLVYRARVREGNLAATKLLLGCGFRHSGTERGAFPHPELRGEREDGYVFEFTRPDAARRRRLREATGVLLP